ncbi:MAG TPA: hypothetical protein VG735_08110 [Caulobacterales bacterium]|nr:hypothetical protein [Caulobacterales bacterium]
MAKETSSARVARIAARILAGGKATPAEVKALAASVLTQREPRPAKVERLQIVIDKRDVERIVADMKRRRRL